MNMMVSQDYIDAAFAVRQVIGGEEGGAVTERVAMHFDDLRRELGACGDEYEAREVLERFVSECEQAGADGAWPGTYERLQAFAESHFFAYVADELRAEHGGVRDGSIIAEIGDVLVWVVVRAVALAGESMIGEMFGD